VGKPARNHLILAFNSNGIGELWLGLRVAMELKKMGDGVAFLTLEGNTMPLRGEFPFRTFKTATSPLLPFLVERLIRESKAASLIFADYLTCGIFLRGFGQTPGAFQKIGVPMIAIDTWDSTKSPATIDCFLEDRERVPAWCESITPICPVPFLSPDTPGAYQSLPLTNVAPAKVRKHIRHTLGLKPTDRAILFCTAKWQHMDFRSDAGRLLAAALPRLVADHVKRMDDSVHLIHVGPAPYPFSESLNQRYHWIAPLPPREFDSLVSATDLLLSANISATTIGKAMAARVPTLVLQNSVGGGSVEEIEQAIGKPLSGFTRGWVHASAPLYPFSLWPVGYYSFLKPVLRDNPYVGALDVVEMLDEEAVQNALTRLTKDRAAREEQLHRQAGYLARVNMCPSAAERVHSLC
jgi:hypothetical protein